MDTTLQSLQQGTDDAHEALLCTLRLCRLACRIGADAQHAQHVLAWLAQGGPTGGWPRLPPYVKLFTMLSYINCCCVAVLIIR